MHDAFPLEWVSSMRMGESAVSIEYGSGTAVLFKKGLNTSHSSTANLVANAELKSIAVMLAQNHRTQTKTSTKVDIAASLWSSRAPFGETEYQSLVILFRIQQ